MRNDDYLVDWLAARVGASGDWTWEVDLMAPEITHLSETPKGAHWSRLHIDYAPLNTMLHARPSIAHIDERNEDGRRSAEEFKALVRTFLKETEPCS